MPNQSDLNQGTTDILAARKSVHVAGLRRLLAQCGRSNGLDTKCALSRLPARSRSDKWSREDLRYVFELLRDVEQRTRVLRQHIQRSHSEGRFQQKRRIAVEALVGGELTPDSLVELTASPGIKQRNARVHR
jgi:hypothetical protein